MSKERSISTTFRFLSFALLALAAPGLGVGCTCEDEPIKLPPLPKLPPPAQRAVKAPAPLERPSPRATPAERAKAVYRRLVAALSGSDDLALLGLFAASLRQQHGDKALLSTLRAHAKRHGAQAVDPLMPAATVETKAGGKLRLVVGHTTCELVPQPVVAKGLTKQEGAALAAPLKIAFLGVRSDLRFETYTVLLVSSEGLLSTAGKLRRKHVPRRELLRVGGKK